MTRIAVILVSCNQQQDACEYLASLEREHQAEKSIVFVGNASEDGTYEEIEKRDSQNVVLRLARNKGFAAANNIGIRDFFRG